LNVTSKSNGGLTTKVSLTYAKAFDDVSNNADVLSLCCVSASNLGVATNMVQDAYGGYCGTAS
jgi:hypothetical protein